MRILHISTNDISGGAAVAANRLHNTLRKNGIDSYMSVQRKRLNDKYIIGAKSNLFFKSINYLRKNVDSIPKRFYPKRERVPWSVNWLHNPFLIRNIKKVDPDIIHFHWINGGFVSINDIKRISKLGKPIVWTLHDSWAFTGGCHIPYNCKKYKKNCGSCPLLRSKDKNDLSNKIFFKKKKLFDNINFDIITPSNWLASCAMESRLLKNKNITVIPNYIDINMFKSLHKKLIRKELNLEENKKYILFGAVVATTDKNKGFDLLIDSLKLIKNKENIELLIFGNNNNFKINLDIKIRCFGRIKNSKLLNKLYSASDVTVVPSKSENFSNIILESFLSGTPVVAFKIGGLPDLIDHKKNGYLAKPFNIKDLANGIRWCIEDKKRNEMLCKNSRKYVLEKFSKEVIVRKIIQMYENLLKK